MQKTQPVGPEKPRTQAIVTQKPIKTLSNENDLRKKLEQLYKDVKSVPSYSAKISDFLRKNDVHGVYKRISKKTFPRRRVIVGAPFHLFMADLIEYPRDKFVNRQYKFILILIDCFTKKIFAAPMKRKTKEWAADAFESIFKKFDQFPTMLVTDGGLEFFNSAVAKVFDSYGIHHYKIPTKSKWKASIAERAIRTIKTRLEKYFSVGGKRNWIDVIDQFVSNYNDTPHSSHGYSPNKAVNKPVKEIFKKLYPNNPVSVASRLNIGDRVRKIRDKAEFEKGYTENWSKQIYKISSVRQSNGICWYKLEDLEGKSLSGIWYYYQLNLVSKNDNTSSMGSKEPIGKRKRVQP